MSEDGMVKFVLSNGEVAGVKMSNIDFHDVDPAATPTEEGELYYFERIEELIGHLASGASLSLSEGDQAQ